MSLFEYNGLSLSDFSTFAHMADAAYEGASQEVGGGWSMLTGQYIGFNDGFVDGSYDDVYYETDILNFGRGSASAFYNRSENALAISFRGTDSYADYLDYPSLLGDNTTIEDNNYLSHFIPFLGTVIEFATSHSITSSSLWVTGHSLGAGLANILSEVANGAYALFAAASYVTFATPRVDNTDVFNIGFENDGVFRVLDSYDDGSSTTDNILFYDDAYASGSEPGASFNLLDHSAHDRSNYIKAVEQISQSRFYDEMTRDSNVVVVATSQKVTDHVTVTNEHHDQPTYYVGRQNIADWISAGNGDDTLEGLSGDDLLSGGGGNDRIDGGEGYDHAIFDGLRTDYRITGEAGGEQTVTNIVTSEVDRLYSIECIQFDSSASHVTLDNTFVEPGSSRIARNDDGSSSFIDITSVFDDGLNFFGHAFTGLYVNNNGNVTFGSSLSSFTPNVIGGQSSLAIIAPFWGDVDTRGAGSLVSYGLDAERGTFTATWANVDYYNATGSNHASLFNSFQLELIDQGCGDFEIIYRYGGLSWTAGDASGGQNGLGGSVARAGFSSGDGIHYFELPQSGSQGGMLGLNSAMGNAGAGVWLFSVRDGEIAGIGTTGDDTLAGDDGDNYMDGGDGNDVLDGGVGNDTISGGAGDDTVRGGSGNDILIAGHGQGNDSYDGGSDNDTITFLSSTLGVVVDLQNGFSEGEEIGHDTIVNVENVTGGSGADTIFGDGMDNRLIGMGRADHIDGGAGRDTAVFSSAYADYAIAQTTTETGAAAVLVNGGPDGGDTLQNIERIEFSDGIYSVRRGVFLGSSNLAPIAHDDAFAIAEDTVLQASALSDDSDATTLFATLVSGPSNGTVSLNENGTFIYTPNANYFGTDSFVYSADDGEFEAAATVTINVLPVNDGPSADGDGPYSGIEDTILTVDAAHGVLAGDTDVDSSPLAAQLVSGPAHGTITLNGDGSFVYNPVANFNGHDSFVYAASDGAVTSAQITVGLDIAAVNDAPIALGDAGFIVARNKPLVISATKLLKNDDDGDADVSQPMKIVSVSSASHGKVALKGSSITFTPQKDYSGAASFTYKMSDGNGGVATTKVFLAVASADGTVTLMGSTADDVLVGSKSADKISGSAGNDVITGGLGNDTLTGGAGQDSFVFNSKLGGKTNVDRITDFRVVDDTIRLDDFIFKGLKSGTLASSAFAINNTGDATDTKDRVIYDKKTGDLFFDADGSGKGDSVLFAHLSAGLKMTNSDFFVV